MRFSPLASWAEKEQEGERIDRGVTGQHDLRGNAWKAENLLSVGSCEWHHLTDVPGTPPPPVDNDFDIFGSVCMFCRFWREKNAPNSGAHFLGHFGCKIGGGTRGRMPKLAKSLAMARSSAFCSYLCFHWNLDFWFLLCLYVFLRIGRMGVRSSMVATWVGVLAAAA